MSSDRDRRRRLQAVAGVALLIACISTAAIGEEVIPEYQLKAEFLERFTRFIEWPITSPVNDGQTSFTICVAGTDPFGPYLKNLAANRRIKAKPILVRQVSSDFDSCHMLFIAAMDKANALDVVRKTSDRPIVTVADTPGLGEAGVMINFYRRDDKVRFEINALAAERSGLRISSKLLKLARVVGEE